jgi:plastocyanin
MSRMIIAGRAGSAIVVSVMLHGLLSCGTSNQTAPSPAQQPGAVPEVTITIPLGGNMRGTSAYDPNPMQVDPGTRVTWSNNDSIPHTATDNNGAFDTGTIPPGGRASYVASQAGTFSYHCSIHPGMSGTLRVGPAAVPAPSASPGSGISCSGVPESTACDGGCQPCTPGCTRTSGKACSAGRCVPTQFTCAPNPSPTSDMSCLGVPENSACDGGCQPCTSGCTRTSGKACSAGRCVPTQFTCAP